MVAPVVVGVALRYLIRYGAPKAIKKFGKKAINRVKAEMKEMDRIDLAQGNKPSTKVLLGGGTANLAAMALLKPIEKYLTKRKKKKDVLKKAEQKKQRTQSRKVQRKVRIGKRGYRGL